MGDDEKGDGFYRNVKYFFSGKFRKKIANSMKSPNILKKDKIRLGENGMMVMDVLFFGDGKIGDFLDRKIWETLLVLPKNIKKENYNYLRNKSAKWEEFYNRYRYPSIVVNAEKSSNSIDDLNAKWKEFYDSYRNQGMISGPKYFS